jgi:amidase
MPQMHELSALEQAAAIRRGDFSSAELTAFYLDRIAALDGALGAFVTVRSCRPEGMGRHGTVRDDGAGTGDGPLAGVPTAIKDLTPTAGMRTTLGSAAFRDWVPDVDAHVVTAVRAAGMPIIGKTATSEFGAALYTETALGPPARNPWSLDLTPGGSSGGAAAAVAAGLLPVAHGSDGGGSVRIPAALCGLVGYKPSRGLVPVGPGSFGAFGLPVHGAIGRTVADCAALVAVMGRPVPGEPYLPPFAAATLVDEAPAGRPLRIGRFTGPMLAECPVDPDCVKAVDAVSATLADSGHHVVDIDPPFDPSVFPLFEVVWAALSAVPLPPDGETLLTPLVRWLRDRGTTLTAGDLTAALTGLQYQVERAAARLAAHDLTLCPTLAGTRAAVGEFTAAGDPAEDFAMQARFSPYCAVFNLLGAPAIQLPVTVTAAGLPVGAQLAAAPGADRRMLAVAAAVERALPWSGRHPAIWDSVSGPLT